MNETRAGAAARALAAALEKSAVLHQPGQREQYRALLALAIEHADVALTVADGADAAGLVAISVRAHAAKVDDALHGASQLSLSAQRAPTRAACDDGWERVEAIVVGAETSARVAASRMAALADDRLPRTLLRTLRAAAEAAEVHARAARRIVEERNHAYTFHTDSAFSFGEGWYLAAAALLADARIQLEPDKAGTEQAERFLRDTGLTSQIVPYRSRPRAMKQTTELVGSAFKADPVRAQARLRAAFLGDAPIADAVSAWIEQQLRAARVQAQGRRLVLVWIRDGAHQAERNTTVVELCELCACVEQAGLVPVLIGDAYREAVNLEGAIDFILFWKEPLFRGLDRRRAQLQFFEYLRVRHRLVGQLGVTTAGMDGPALMGLPTLYLTEAPNVRMREWVGCVPGYTEVVRENGYLERVARALAAWAQP